MATKRRSAYDLSYEQVALSAAEQWQALLWWQSGADYHPLSCPICAAALTVSPTEAELLCPTSWCSYVSREIPWGVYAAWQRFVSRKTGESGGA